MRLGGSLLRIWKSQGRLVGWRAPKTNWNPHNNGVISTDAYFFLLVWKLVRPLVDWLMIDSSYLPNNSVKNVTFLGWWVSSRDPFKGCPPTIRDQVGSRRLNHLVDGSIYRPVQKFPAVETGPFGECHVGVAPDAFWRLEILLVEVFHEDIGSKPRFILTVFSCQMHRTSAF